MEIIEVSAEDDRLAPMIAALRAELDARYPEEISFEHPTVKRAARFLLVLDDGEPVGCCAVQPLEGGDSELKRMYVSPDQRGRGVGARLVAQAQRLAISAGLTRMRLETGLRQPEAIAVYEKAGFTPIPNYPPYDQWDMSRCYAKELSHG